MELKRIKEFIINDRSFPLFIEEVEKSLKELHQGTGSQSFTQPNLDSTQVQKLSKKSQMPLINLD